MVVKLLFFPQFTKFHIILRGRGGDSLDIFLFWLLPLPGGSKVAIMGWKVIYAPIIGYSKIFCKISFLIPFEWPFYKKSLQ